MDPSSTGSAITTSFNSIPPAVTLSAWRADFEASSSDRDDFVRLGMVDTEDGDKWIESRRDSCLELASGLYAAVASGSNTEVIFNDRVQDRFVSHILNVRTREEAHASGCRSIASQPGCPLGNRK